MLRMNAHRDGPNHGVCACHDAPIAPGILSRPPSPVPPLRVLARARPPRPITTPGVPACMIYAHTQVLDVDDSNSLSYAEMHYGLLKLQVRPQIVLTSDDFDDITGASVVVAV